MNTAAIGRLILDALAANPQALVVLIGSNGAGKSTFYERNLADSGLDFVNADNIAKGLAGRFSAIDEGMSKDAMDRAEAMRQRYVAARRPFIMETVLSDPYGAKLDFMRDAKEKGYYLVVIHIRLDDPSISVARVMERVEQGGHDVPNDRLLSRFPRTARNAAVAVTIADLALVFDNSVVGKSFQWIETWQGGVRVDQDTFGFKPFPSRGGIVTNELIDAIRDEEGI